MSVNIFCGLGISNNATGGGGGGTVTSVTGTAPLVSSGGATPDLAIAPVGQTRGDILYRNATAWTRLPAGTDGQLLETRGIGADPHWVNPPSSGVSSVAASSPLQSSGGLTPTISLPAATDGQSMTSMSGVADWRFPEARFTEYQNSLVPPTNVGITAQSVIDELKQLNAPIYYYSPSGLGGVHTFTSWSDLVATVRLTTNQGPVRIVLAPDVTTIPDGAWDLSIVDYSIEGAFDGTGSSITWSSGCTISGWPTEIRNVYLEGVNASGTLFSTGAVSTVILSGHTILRNNGTAPSSILSVTGSLTNIILKDLATIQEGDNDMPAVLSDVIVGFTTFDAGSVQNLSIEAANLSISKCSPASSFNVNQTAGSSMSLSQNSIASEVQYNNSDFPAISSLDSLTSVQSAMRGAYVAGGAPQLLIGTTPGSAPSETVDLKDGTGANYAPLADGSAGTMELYLTASGTIGGAEAYSSWYFQALFSSDSGGAYTMVGYNSPSTINTANMTSFTVTPSASGSGIQIRCVTGVLAAAKLNITANVRCTYVSRAV